MTATSAGRRIHRSIVILALATSGGCSLFGADRQSATTSASSSATVACATAVEAVTAGARGDQPASISADAAGDVWAVGTHWHGAGVGAPLAERWNGSAWDPEALTADEFRGIHLEGVDVRAAGDVWAVGSGKRGAPAVIHLSGTTWSVEDAPISRQSALLGVTAVSADDVWAVGSSAPGGTDQQLILHRTAGGWATVPGADVPGIGSLLSDVSTGGNVVWAVGSSLGTDRRYHPLAERWDGTSWRVVPTPAPADDALFKSVAIVDGAVWAVGWAWAEGEPSPIVLRYDGSTWTKESLPGDAGARTEAAAVAGVDGGVLVVGRARDATGIYRPAAFRWDGSTWTGIAVGAPGTGNGGLVGVADRGAGGWLAIGSMGGEGGGGSFVPIAAQGC